MIASLVMALAGVTLPVRPLVADVVLDSASPDTNIGREFISQVGKGKVLLVTDLALAEVGVTGRQVKSGSLVLTLVSGVTNVTSVRLVKKAWEEGAGGQAALVADTYGATWKSARKGSLWQEPGAGGAEDSTPVEGWKASVKGDRLTIEGLGSAFAQIARRSPGAFSLRLEFEGEASVGSAETPSFAPKFEYETEPLAGGANLQITAVESPGAAIKAGSTVEAEVEIKNAGSAASAETTLSVGGKSVPVPSVAAGASTKVKVAVEVPSGDAALITPVTFVLGAESSAQTLRWHPLGLAVSGPDEVAPLVNRLNGWILPFSRFSFAAGGVGERFRFTRIKEQADLVVDGGADLEQEIVSKAVAWQGPILRSGPGLSLDTRDERLAVPGVPLTALGWGSRFDEEAPLIESGLLGRFEAGKLHQLAGVRGEARNAWRPLIPKTLVLRVFDLSGRPLANEPVLVFSDALAAQTGAAPLLKTKTLNTGGLLITPTQFEPSSNQFFGADDPMTKGITLVIGKGELAQTFEITKRDIVEESLRGPAPLVSMELRVPFARGPVDVATNTALNKSVEDSSGRFPAQLAALVDGRDETSVPMAASVDGSSWAEIDLGRDRIIAEIEIRFKGKPSPGIQLSSYGTSQPPSSAQMWVKDLSCYLRLTPEGSVIYRGSSTLMRYIRVAPLGSGVSEIAEVIVRPLQNVIPEVPPQG